jgi:hypothetical protein
MLWLAYVRLYMCQLAVRARADGEPKRRIDVTISVSVFLDRKIRQEIKVV